MVWSSASTRKRRPEGTENRHTRFIQAAEYVESQFKRIGLKPAGTNDYLQPVSFRTAVIDADHSSVGLISADGQRQTLKVGPEVTLSPNDEGNVTAPVFLQVTALSCPALALMT